MWAIFSQVMSQYRGNAGVPMLSSAEQFRAIDFAQFTWHVSQCDSKVSLSTNARTRFNGCRVGQRPGQVNLQAQCFLHDGSRLSRILALAFAVRRLPCYANPVNHGCTTLLFGRRRLVVLVCSAITA